METCIRAASNIQNWHDNRKQRLSKLEKMPAKLLVFSIMISAFYGVTLSAPSDKKDFVLNESSGVSIFMTKPFKLDFPTNKQLGNVE